MKKQTIKQWMTAAAMVLGLLTTTAMVTSCSDKDTAAYAIDNVITQDPEAEPTDDQLTTKVTEDLEAAVIGTPAEGSVGAALMKRLPEVYSDISALTDLVLICGSELGTLSKHDLEEAAYVYLDGGYVGLLEPTMEQAGQFFDDFEEALETAAAQLYEEQFDIDEETAAAAARHSMTGDRMQTRAANMQAIATRAGTNAGDELFAELFIIGPTAYFMQDPLDEDLTTSVSYGDADGNETEAETVTTRVGKTAYRTGLWADAAAQWLNETAKADEEADATNAPALNASATRADAAKAINDLIGASESFTFSGPVVFPNNLNSTSQIEAVNGTVRSWGVHNINSNKDYYYVKESVTLGMGNTKCSPRDEESWWNAEHFGDYNGFYGSFLVKYRNSMELKGNGGTIHLEAATPETENYTSTSTVSTTSISTKTETMTTSWSLTAGFQGGNPVGTGTIGGSYAAGYTEGNSFTMGNARPQKDLGVAKNTNGNTVEWTYKGNLPKLYIKDSSDSYRYCHQLAADVLTNDANLTNEACWSVEKPVGQYTIHLESEPITGCLVYKYDKNGPREPDQKYFYYNPSTKYYSHTLLQPNRVSKTWRTYLTIDEWTNGYQAGAKDKLEARLKEKFPDTYRDNFQISGKDDKDLSLANAYFQNLKKLYATQNDLLLEYARDLGIKQFSINWRCDDQNVALREPLVIAPPTAPDNRVAQVFWCEGSGTLYFVNALAQAAGSKWNNDVITTVYPSEALSWVPWLRDKILPKVTRVVFNKDFADVRPSTMDRWFDGAVNLKTIEGLEYLNTSEVKSTLCMFRNCKSLTILDVSNFDVGKVGNGNLMFDDCTSLTTIYCNQSWPNIGLYMFSGCTSLRGAVSFDSGKTNGDMANPKTGYFTVKPDPEPDYSNLPTIYLKDKQKNATLIQEHQGQQVNVIYSRALTADKTADGKAVPTPWTVCLPYDFDLSARIQSGQVSLYTLAAVENGEFVFVKLTDTKLTAGVPYVVMVNSGRVPLRAQGVTISATKPSSLRVYNSVSAWRNKIGTTVGYWTGTFDLLDADYAAGVGAFALQATDKNWNFFNSKGTATIPAFRAYLTSTNIDEQVYKARYE